MGVESLFDLMNFRIAFHVRSMEAVAQLMNIPPRGYKHCNEGPLTGMRQFFEAVMHLNQ